MAFPKLLQRLFQNNGAGDKLNKAIVPDLDYLPKSGGTVDGSVTINGTSVTDESLSTTYKKGIKFGWGSEISQSIPNGLDIWATRGDSETVLALYAEAKGNDNGNTPGIYLRAGNGTTTKDLRLTTSAATIDGVEIATLNTASRNLGATSMVGLGFAKDSTVTLVQFLQKLAEKGFNAVNSVLRFSYLYTNSAYVTDGTNTVRIVGGTLYLGYNGHNPSDDYGVAWGFFVPAEGSKLYRFRTYKDISQAASYVPQQAIYTYESVTSSSLTFFNGKTPTRQLCNYPAERSVLSRSFTLTGPYYGLIKVVSKEGFHYGSTDVMGSFNTSVSGENCLMSYAESGAWTQNKNPRVQTRVYLVACPTTCVIRTWVTKTSEGGTPNDSNFYTGLEVYSA